METKFVLKIQHVHYYMQRVKCSIFVHRNTEPCEIHNHYELMKEKASLIVMIKIIGNGSFSVLQVAVNSGGDEQEPVQFQVPSRLHPCPGS